LIPRAWLIVIIPLRTPLNFDRSREHHGCGSRQPEMFSRSCPGHRCRPSRQFYADFRVQQTVLMAHRDRRTGAGAAGQCFSGAAFVHAQANVPAIHDLHETDIGALGEPRMPLDSRPKAFDRRGFHVADSQYRMRIAHGYRAEFHPRAVDVEGIGGASAGASRGSELGAKLGMPISRETVPSL
jgi:hypothetical protein